MDRGEMDGSGAGTGRIDAGNCVERFGFKATAETIRIFVLMQCTGWLGGIESFYRHTAKPGIYFVWAEFSTG